MHPMFGRRSSDNRDEDGKYSNYFEIGFNGYAFIFEFAMVTSTGADRCVSRVVMNPADAEQFSELLAETVDQHINRYGPIKRAPDRDAGNRERFRDIGLAVTRKQSSCLQNERRTVRGKDNERD